mmetsp:Transcript_47529/g.118784  ORF Transcript_47529/g.118784 Transcript_47529/m.118784 type:complete len:105 (-) Transcript_47529:249-563(-)
MRPVLFSSFFAAGSADDGSWRIPFPTPTPYPSIHPSTMCAPFMAFEPPMLFAAVISLSLSLCVCVCLVGLFGAYITWEIASSLPVAAWRVGREHCTYAGDHGMV